MFGGKALSCVWVPLAQSLWCVQKGIRACVRSSSLPRRSLLSLKGRACRLWLYHSQTELVPLSSARVRNCQRTVTDVMRPT